MICQHFTLNISFFILLIRVFSTYSHSRHTALHIKKPITSTLISFNPKPEALLCIDTALDSVHSHPYWPSRQRQQQWAMNSRTAGWGKTVPRMTTWPCEFVLVDIQSPVAGDDEGSFAAWQWPSLCLLFVAILLWLRLNSFRCVSMCALLTLVVRFLF